MNFPSDETLAVSLASFYADLAASDSAARRVGWESDAAHRLRLHGICDVLQPLQGIVSIVDVGCGEARLLEALRVRGFRGAYRGEDLLEHHLARARAAFSGDGQAVFIRANGLGPSPSASVVVCSGTFNTRVVASAADDASPSDTSEVEAHETYVIAALHQLWARCEDTLVVDLAIADRHPPGVGIGRVRLGRIVDALRDLAPVIAVHEDGVPGEALFVASRFRRRSISRRLDSAREQAEVLLAQGDGTGAMLALDSAGDDGHVRLMRGTARFQSGDLSRAEKELEALLPSADASFGAEVRIVLAQVKWRLRRFREARALLEVAALHSDHGRSHLAHALAGFGLRDEALAVVGRIEDRWMRRELERHFGS